MFKNQRQGNPLYILHKGNTPFCEVGSIVSVSPPRPENPNFNMYGPQAKIVVDIKAKIGEDNVSFSNVLSDVTITDYPTTNGEKLVVSCDLGALNTEINAMMQQSRQALDSIDYHKSVIEGCEKMLVILNPEFAREKERESEIANMRNEMSDLKEANARLVAMMEQLVGSVNGNNNNNKKTE